LRDLQQIRRSKSTDCVEHVAKWIDIEGIELVGRHETRHEIEDEECRRLGERMVMENTVKK
jgi:hypothetical protein